MKPIAGVAAMLFTTTLVASSAFGADSNEARTDAVAQKLVRLTTPESTYREMMLQMWDQMKAGLEAELEKQGEKGQTINTAALEQLKQDVLGIFTYAEFSDACAAIMTKHFTDDELRQILAFYATPIGKKTIAVMPQTMADGMAWSMHAVQERMPMIMEKFMKTIAE